MRPISEVMTRDVAVIPPDATLQRAAEMMRDLDLRALPVCHGSRLMGMVTDRDIVVRSVANGVAPTVAHVADVMSTDVAWAFEDQTEDEAVQLMLGREILRLPIVTRDMELVGVVSLSSTSTRPTLQDVSRRTQ